MPEGLDAIAIAVARLEEERKKEAIVKTETVEQASPSTAAAENQSTMSNNEAPPMPTRQGVAAAQQPRVVSAEETAAMNSEEQAQSKSETKHGFSMLPAASVVQGSPAASTDEVVPVRPTLSKKLEITSLTLPLPHPVSMTINIRALSKIIFSLDLGELKRLPTPDASEVITVARENDVLFGRGGESNNHPGNQVYRACVTACKPYYIAAVRREKPFVAQRIVLAVRRIGGRFLKRDSGSDTFRDVGNNRAREKTSQALREGAPELRLGEEKLGQTVNLPLRAEVLKRRLSGPAVAADTESTSGQAVTAEASSTGGGQEDQDGSPRKKRRVSLFDLADAATDSAAPSSSNALAALPAPSVGNGQSAYGCAATVSADDEEDSHPSRAPSPPTRQFKGPRIKLLKKRLEARDS